MKRSILGVCLFVLACMATLLAPSANAQDLPDGFEAAAGDDSADSAPAPTATDPAPANPAHAEKATPPDPTAPPVVDPALPKDDDATAKWYKALEDNLQQGAQPAVVLQLPPITIDMTDTAIRIGQETALSMKPVLAELIPPPTPWYEMPGWWGIGGAGTLIAVGAICAIATGNPLCLTVAIQ